MVLAGLANWNCINSFLRRLLARLFNKIASQYARLTATVKIHVPSRVLGIRHVFCFFYSPFYFTLSRPRANVKIRRTRLVRSLVHSLFVGMKYRGVLVRYACQTGRQSDDISRK